MTTKKTSVFISIIRLFRRFQFQKYVLYAGLFLVSISTVFIFNPTVFSATAPAPALIPSVQTKYNDAPQLLEQGKNLYKAGQFAEALTVWQEAAQLFKTQNDVLNQAIALNDISLAYQRLGQLSPAQAAIASSLNLLQTRLHNGNSKERQRILAQSLNTQGSLQLEMGQSEQALTTWQQATATYTRAGFLDGIISSLVNQAKAMQSLGQYSMARETLEQSLQKLQKQPPSIINASALRSLGNAWQVAGDLKKSRQALEQSLALAQQFQSPTDIGQALLSLGNTVQAQGDTQGALKFFQQAAEASPTSTMRTQAQLNQLSLLLSTKDLSPAQDLWPQIQHQLAELSSSRSSVYANINLAQSLMRLQQTNATRSPSEVEVTNLLTTAIQQAKSLGDQRAEAYALGHLGGLYEQTHKIAPAQSLTEQALVIAQSINAPDIRYRYEWQMGRLLKAQGDIKGAIAAYTQSVEDLKALRNNLVGINTDIQFSFREQVEPIYRQLVDLLLASDQPSQDNLKAARQTIESLQLAELDNFFRVACLEGKQVQLDEVVDKQDPSAAVIYPIVLPERIGIILKLPKQSLLQYYQTVIPEKKVESLLENLQEKLTQSYSRQDIPPLSRQVYDWLLRPAEANLIKHQVKTLVFILDGSLRNISMSALYDGKQYLIEKYAVALTPGLQLLAPKAIKKVNLKVLSGGMTEASSGFPALSNVGAELAQIKSKIPGTELLNQKFTSKILQKEMNSYPFPIVHLATHGQFSSQADKTFILAWNNERIDVTKLTDLLQSQDTSSGNQLELLTLSACETATGDKRATLGLAGVAVRAGARSTLASLWSVEDPSVLLLMSLFYQNLAEKHMTKAEALRQAQIYLLINSRYKAPYFWSAFVLLGNWL